MEQRDEELFLSVVRVEVGRSDRFGLDREALDLGKRTNRSKNATGLAVSFTAMATKKVIRDERIP